MSPSEGSLLSGSLLSVTEGGGGTLLSVIPPSGRSAAEENSGIGITEVDVVFELGATGPGVSGSASVVMGATAGAAGIG
jgi:hypothetical protein